MLTKSFLRCYPGTVTLSANVTICTKSSYKTLLHIEGGLLREQDRIHYRSGRVDTLITKEEAVRSFTLVRLGRKYGAEVHVHVKGVPSALMRIHR
jgi:hypothetical protein